MREDWHLVPDLFTIAKHSMQVVKMNLSFTVLYNLVGLWLAALGLLPRFWRRHNLCQISVFLLIRRACCARNFLQQRWFQQQWNQNEIFTNGMRRPAAIKVSIFI
jgi:hypothetical protein